MYMYLHIQMEVNQRCQIHRPERDLPKSNAHMHSQNTEDGSEGRGSIAKYLTKKPQLRTESKVSFSFVHFGSPSLSLS